MITNRTQYDVDTAIYLISQKVQTFQELTEGEIDTLERGAITYNTLNRIEEKQDVLKGLFNTMGYWNTPTINKQWDETQIFDEVEFQRIIDNTNILREAFFVKTETPNTPPVSYHFNDINALEKILYDLDVMISDVRSYYRQCGIFECGE